LEQEIIADMSKIKCKVSDYRLIPYEYEKLKKKSEGWKLIKERMVLWKRIAYFKTDKKRE
jgi:hypothetical protein